MNATESWYRENHLEGKYRRIEFEGIKIVLAHANSETKSREATYLPDFYCCDPADGSNEIHIHEVKGYCDEADRLKVKFSAEKHPEWRWYLVHISGKPLRITKIEEF